ncbi:MAG: hypothetical protein HC881_12375 [Leptolyngbyaceae cyanobacterium SL_7_1]|nr:hypothetical protein [Leptolyngbyaceae cyanobacterium SL_7_1]
MFSETNGLAEPAVLLTIACEEVVKDSILGLLKNLQVQSYTVTRVAATDRYGTSMGEATGATDNSEIKAIVSREVSDVVLHTLQKYLSDRPIIAYRQEIEALVN